MAQAANTADFLGEGTAATGVAPGQLTQQQLDDDLLRKNMAAHSAAANQTSAANFATPNSDYMAGRQVVTPTGPAPASGYLPRPDPGSFSSGIVPTLKAISRDPVTAAVLAAPYGVLGAGAALGGLAAGGAGTIAGGSAAAAPAITTGGAVTGGTMAAPAAAAAAAPAVAAAAAPAAAAGSSMLAPALIGGGVAAGNIIGGALGAANHPMPNVPATPALANRPEANLTSGFSGAGGAAPAVQNTGNLAALNAAITGAQTPQSTAQRLAAAAPSASPTPTAGAFTRPAATAGGNPALTGAQGGFAGSGAAPPAGAFATGAGSAGISAVDQALTNFRPASAAPPTGSMPTAPGQVSMGALPGREAISSLPGTGKLGALPGTVQQGALPGQATMGALPGATDRTLQTQQLNRLLGYDPNTASKAEAQLADVQQMNLNNSLALARSARGGPAAQAQALRAAQGEGAATMSQTSRDLATLRAQEEDTAKARELQALGLGNDITGQIRTGDIGERGQNVGATEAALTAGVEQRGQNVGAITANQASLAAQRGQTVEALLGERNAGVTERGQTIGAGTAALNAGVAERGQDTQALEAALNAGVTQRGQTVEQQIADRNAGVTERGQTTTAGTAANQQALDALLGRGTLATASLNAGVTERGQTIQGNLGVEQIAQARDAVATSAASEADKTAAMLAVQQAQLGYELTPDQKIAVAKIAASSNDPSLLQIINGGVQAGTNAALTAKLLGA